MANPYFRQVPNFEYVNRNKDSTTLSNYITVKNLFKRAKLRDDIIANLAYFTKYQIIGDDRPDNVAQEVYEDPKLDWLVLLEAIDNSIIMCHPGFYDSKLEHIDNFNKQREKEYNFFASDLMCKVLINTKTNELILKVEEKEGSALGSIGLKPKIVH